MPFRGCPTECRFKNVRIIYSKHELVGVEILVAYMAGNILGIFRKYSFVFMFGEKISSSSKFFCGFNETLSNWKPTVYFLKPFNWTIFYCGPKVYIDLIYYTINSANYLRNILVLIFMIWTNPFFITSSIHIYV